MKSIALALATISFASTPAMAGVYLNAESRDGYTGSDYTGRTVDLHIGYEGNAGKLGYYIQGGPAFTAADGVDGTSNLNVTCCPYGKKIFTLIVIDNNA